MVGSWLIVIDGYWWLINPLINGWFNHSTAHGPQLLFSLNLSKPSARTSASRSPHDMLCKHRPQAWFQPAAYWAKLETITCTIPDIPETSQKPGRKKPEGCPKKWSSIRFQGQNLIQQLPSKISTFQRVHHLQGGDEWINADWHPRSLATKRLKGINKYKQYINSCFLLEHAVRSFSFSHGPASHIITCFKDLQIYGIECAYPKQDRCSPKKNLSDQFFHFIPLPSPKNFEVASSCYKNAPVTTDL